MASESKTTITLEAQVSDALKAMDLLAERFRGVGKAAREGLGQQLKPAADSVENLEGKLKGFKREQVQEGRLVGFYVREIGSFVGMSSEAQNAIGGMTQGMVGLATATGPVLIAWGLFELAAAGLGYIKSGLEETEKQAKSAADSLAKVADRVDELRRKRLNVKDSEVEGGKAEAAERILARRAALQKALETGGGDVAAQSDTARRLNALNEEIAAWEQLNGKLEAYVGLQKKAVGEIQNAEVAQREATAAELRDEAAILKARTPRQRAEAEHSKDVLAAQRKFLAGEFDVAALQAAINNALQKRANVLRDINIEEAAKLGAMAIDIEIAKGVTRERQIELQFEKDMLHVAQLRAQARTKEADLAEQAAKAKRAEALRELEWQRELKLMEQDKAAAYDSGNFPDIGGDAALSATAFRKSEVEDLNKALADQQEMWAAIGSSVSSAFGSIGEMVGGTAGRIIAWLGQMITQAIQLAISLAAASSAWTTPLGAIAIAGTVAAGLMALVSSVSARADGGPIRAGAPYLVGERGPELVVPSSDGTVVPNHKLGGGTVNVTFNAPVDQAWWRSNERHIIRTLREAARAGRA